MRLFPKLLIGILPIVIIPLVLAVLLTVSRGNTLIGQLLLENARSELEFFESRCQQEIRTLESLGLQNMEFYRSSAQRNIIDYVQGRDITGAELFILDQEGRSMLMGSSVAGEVHRITSDFRPWGWTIGIAVSREFLRQFTTESVYSAVWLSVGILIPVVVVGLLLARSLFRPISLLEKSAQLLAAGDLSVQVDIRRRDEIGRLGDAFDRMAASVRTLTHSLEDQVRSRTRDLEASLEELRAAQDMLVKKERLANLGSVVAGLAHEINTPIGISVTSATHLKSIAASVAERYDNSELTGQAFLGFLEDLSQISDLIYDNMQRADSLIRNFKQLSVDEISEQRRRFSLSEQIDSVILSLNPKIKKTRISVVCDIEDDVVVNSYPGVFYQILSNLVSNSITHGYDPDQEGQIRISVRPRGDVLHLVYEDDGKGMDDDMAAQIYEPFVSSRSSEGGSGLGMNIVFNLISKGLNGNIQLETGIGEGVRFNIDIPMVNLQPEAPDSTDGLRS